MPQTDRQVDAQRQRDLHTLLALAGSAAHLGPIVTTVRQLRNELIGAFASGAANPLAVAREIVSDSRERLVTLTSEAVERLASIAVTMNDDATQRLFDLDMAFSASGVALDSFGNPMPEPKMPRDVRWSRADFEHVMRWISPLVVLNGDPEQSRETPLIKLVRGEVDHTQYARNSEWEEFRTDEEIRRQTQVGYKSRARRVVNTALSAALLAAIASQFKRRKPISEISRFLSNRLGLGVDQAPGAFNVAAREGGLIRGLELVVRDRAIQVLELDRQRDYERLDRSLLIGYELRSVLIPTTRPSHASRDGWRFYRDNREGSDLPWNRRIVPPYAHNCLCYTRQLWESPDPYVVFAASPRLLGGHVVKSQDVGGWTFERGRFRQLSAADVGRKLGSRDTPSLVARDVGTWQGWFDNQRAHVKSLIVGERRFLAVQSAGVPSPVYVDFVDEDGKFLSVRKLIGESSVDRRARKASVRQIIRNQVRRQEAAQHRGLKTTGEDEKRRRRRLDLFLRRVS